MKKFLSLFGLLLAVIFLLSGCTLPAELIENPIESYSTDLSVHFIDVGQGDCTLIESRGRFALIDGGEYSERNKVISYLSGQGVKKLDFVISTHPHSDHCGSLSEVLRNFDTTTLICPDVDSDTPVWTYVLDAADERGVSVETPEVYDTYSVGAATVTILSPESDAVYSNLNDYSIVCLVEYGNTSFMLTGDAEAGVEKALVRSGFDLRADVLKCGHHGSYTSSCEEFLDAVYPSAAVISCGKDNDYGHPHKQTISALKERNIPYWRTDTDGNIEIKSDGEQLYLYKNVEVIPVTEPAPTETKKAEIKYLGNKNSMVFHDTDCGSIDETKYKYIVSFTSRKEATDAGYKPCGICKP